MNLALRSLGVTPEVTKASRDQLQLLNQKVVTHPPPLQNRLGALYYSWSFGLGFYSWGLAIYAVLTYPWLLLPLLAYVPFLWTWGAKAAQEGSWPTPLRRWWMWRWCADYFRAQLHKTAELPADKGQTYIFCYHPHGILSFGGWLTFATEALGFSRLFPGIDVRILTLIINFRTPFLREYLLLHGVCDVSKQSCLTLLGRGKSIMIAVGGGTESLYSRPGGHDLVLNRRHGFVKLALLTGSSLVPTYCFGETNTFRTVNELPHASLLRRWQRGMERAFGFTIPLYFGTGIFLPWGFTPYPVKLDVVVGEPVDVPKFEGDPHSAEFTALVDTHHKKYVAALRRLFEANREKYAKGEDNLTLVE